ncbi:hypothetical protein CHR28_02220 [Streptomyces sp. XY006]|nr:hypothetical protein CHR28_02220 [Streptomyces sp. XY006]
MIHWLVDHGMKTRTVLGAVALVTMPLFLATPAQAAAETAPLTTQKVTKAGPVGPGLSELVAIAEGILRK